MKKEEAEQIMKLIKVAQKLGREAGEKQYQKLLGEGDKWIVKDEMNEGKEVGRMLDLCGIGMLNVPGNGKIVKAFKMLATKKPISHDLGYEGMTIYKSSKGYALLLGLIQRQEYSVNEEAVCTVAGYLCSQELECNWRCNID